MKWFASLLLVLLCTLPGMAEMRETGDLRALEPEVTATTLVCFDLDNTLIRTEQMLGSDQWWDDLIYGFVAAGMPERDAVRKAFEAWLPLQKQSRFIAVQSDGPAIVRAMQDKKIMVMGLTARPLLLASLTMTQLASINIDLHLSPPFSAPLSMKLANDTAHYENGILFVGERSSKGEALKAFLERTGLKPDKIVFADDKQHHITVMEQVFGTGPIKYIGFRYGAADAWVKAYDRGIVEIQRKYLGRILSDEAAAKLK